MTSSNCESCKNSSTGSTFLYFFSFQCRTACPDGYYPGAQNRCQPCDSTCKTCTGSSDSECTACKDSGTSNLYFLNNQCLLSCPPKYFSDAQLKCQSCHTTCKTCSTSNLSSDCQSCDSPLKLFSNQCLAQCPDYYGNYQTQTVCDSCDDRCVRCDTSSSSDCSVCKGNNRDPPLCLCQPGWIDFEGRTDYQCYKKEISNGNQSTIVLKTEISISQCQTFDVWSTDLYSASAPKSLVVYGCLRSVLIYDIMAGIRLNHHNSYTSANILHLTVSHSEMTAIMIDDSLIYSNKKYNSFDRF